MERAIIAALTPNNALTTQELCERCYDEPIIKKHRVAVLRALKRVMDRRQDIATLTTEGLGSQVVAYWRYDVTCYAMARLKAEGGNHYRSNDPRLLPHQISDENKLKASLKRGGEHHRHVVKGGRGGTTSSWRLPSVMVTIIRPKHCGPRPLGGDCP